MTLTRAASGAAICIAILLAAMTLVGLGNQRHAQAQVPGVPGMPQVPSGIGEGLVDAILDETPQDAGTPVEGAEIICDDVDPTLEDNDVPNFDCEPQDGGGNGGGDDDDDDDNGGGDDDDDDNTPPADTGSSGGGGGGGGSSKGKVLGAASDTSISCNLYLTEFIRFGGNNNPEQVTRLQSFLNTYEGTILQESGVYDSATHEALKAFQLKYASEILAPWGITSPTGFVYLTTRRKVNEIRCNTLFPLSAHEWQTIQDTRARAGFEAEVPAAAAAAGTLAPAPSFVPDVELPSDEPSEEGEESAPTSRGERGGFWSNFWDWLTGRSR